jgi:hypothetical protein
MAMLVLFGTGLLGIVLSVGTYLSSSSEPGSVRFVEQVARVAKFAVPAVLVLFYLHATYDLGAITREVLSIFTDNLGSFGCRYSSFFSSG